MGKLWGCSIRTLTVKSHSCRVLRAVSLGEDVKDEPRRESPEDDLGYILTGENDSLLHWQVITQKYAIHLLSHLDFS